LVRASNERDSTLLLEGLNSGGATPLTEQDWDDIRQAVRSKVQGDEGLNTKGASTFGRSPSDSYAWGYTN
jgi:antitoxin ParD1/3/4